jgi:DNA repair protein RadD
VKLTLRPYQARGIDGVKRAWISGARLILIVSPTGSGKTALGVGVVEGAVAKGRRVLWLAHRRELISQASERLDAVGCTHHGVILAGHKRDNPLFPIQVASVQTITARGNAPPADIIVWDEAHHCTATTYRDIANAYPTATHFGLTATPERGDGSPLGDVFQAMVVVASIHELQDEGHLVRCTVIGPDEVRRDLAVGPVEMYAKHARNRRAIMFAANLTHMRALAASFNLAGYRAECIEGETKNRDKILARLASGETRVVCNVFCLTEGTDVPAVACVGVMRGCSAWSAWVQMGGRGLRPSPGKEDLILLDPRGHVWAHGLLDDERVFSLAGKASKPKAGAVALRRCAPCGAIFRYQPLCPRCGAGVPPPELPKVNDRPVGEISSVSVAPWSARRRAFDELVSFAKANGYDPRWVGIRFKSRFGSWPPWPLPKGRGAKEAANA